LVFLAISVKKITTATEIRGDSRAKKRSKKNAAKKTQQKNAAKKFAGKIFSLTSPQQSAP